VKHRKTVYFLPINVAVGSDPEKKTFLM